jgi:DNA-binding response OmpR family regulator
VETKRILLVDDEKAFCDVVKENVELRGGYRIHVSNNGKDALKAARTFRPDLIILDIRMPVMDGFKVLEELKKDTSTLGIPVIVMTALDDDTSKIRAASLYGDRYLVKPVKISELLMKIKEVIG